MLNSRHKVYGHLFQGRYKALLVDQDQYLLELVRYIHLNPVRARLVRDPAQYPWSAHRAYLGRSTLAWLTTESVLGQLGGSLGVARGRYARFVAQGIDQGHRPEFYSGDEDSRVIGDERFVEHLGSLVSASHGGQVAIRELLEAHLRRVDRDPMGRVSRLYPFTRKRADRQSLLAEPKLVMIDPEIQFGRPVLTGSGIPTLVIADRAGLVQVLGGA
jgi:hypothetical protein